VTGHRRGNRRAVGIRLARVCLCAGVAAGAWLLTPASPSTGTASAVDPSRLVGPRAAPAVAPPVLGAEPVTEAPARGAAVPVRLRIPALRVDVQLETLGVGPGGTLNAPTRWGVPGWYAGGPRPGDPGPAVIAGHVDSTTGPAVFFLLRRLGRGDAVYVTDRSGRVWRFVVDDIRTFAKTRFPTAFVYGPQPVPVLRLITCTGDFDAAQHSYRDNLVVSAHLV
jgi:sortase (surface protein transpeptidase)